MIGIVLVTHGQLGEEFLNTAQKIVGDIESCQWVSIDADKSMDTIIQEIEQAVNACDCGQGVLILTDMFGGSPTTLSLSVFGKRTDLEVISGVNLPMLLKAFNLRDKELSFLAKEVKDAGKRAIKVAGEILNKPVR
ncbi:MAG: PTS sugar transporter subunit IIA [Desulfonauticus sp.]|nr:PTS sugar transporter subunit IIA [Desulfonauticus sp.]